MRLWWVVAFAVSGSAAAADPVRFPPLLPTDPAPFSQSERIVFVGVGPAGAVFTANQSIQNGGRSVLYRTSGLGPTGTLQRSAASQISLGSQRATLVGEDTFLTQGSPGLVAVRSREFGMAVVRDGAGAPFRAGWLGAVLGPLAFASGESSGWFAIDSATLRASSLRPAGASTQAVVVGSQWLIPDEAGLWTSDGSEAGTRQALAVPGGVKAVVPLAAGLLLVGPTGQLSLADAALSRVAPLPALPGPALNVGVVGDSALLMTASVGFFQLHRTDGLTVTAYATVPGVFSGPLDTPSDAGVIFAARTGAAGTLMVTDGTAAGTRALAPGFLYSGAAARLGDRLVFCGQTNAEGSELWVTDGSPAGTRLLVELRPGNTSGCQGIWSAFAGGVLFSGNDGASGLEPWFTDGTAAGTRLVADLVRSGDAQVGALVPLGAEVVFRALDATGANAVVSSRRASLQLETLFTTSFSSATWLGALGDRVLFQGFPTPTSPLALFATDGSREGTRPIPLTRSFLIRESAVSQGTLFFAGSSDEGTELWSTQGTTASTRLWLDLVPGPESSFPTNLVGDDDRLWFVAGGASGAELWLRRGDDARLVKDLWPGLPSSRPQRLTPVRGTLFFTAYEPASGRELYASQGTAATTRQVLDLEPGPDSADLQVVAAFGDDVLLGARRPTGHGELWRVDREGARPTRLAQFAPGVTVSAIRVLDAQAWFTVGPDAPELWRTDGTPEGTVRRAAVPGNGRLETVGNVLYFDAADDASGIELRRWLPNAPAPELVVEAAPGPASARIDAFVATDAGSSFVAYEVSNGTTLWSVPADVSGPRVVARLEGTLGAQGFYTSDVQVRFEVSDEDSEVYAQQGCDGGTLAADAPTPVTFTCGASSLGGTTVASVEVKRDAAAPALECPARVSLADGAALTLELSVTDAADPSPALVVTPALGTVLPSGTTLVDVVATDAAGNLSTCSVRVDVGGTAPPPGTAARCGCASGEGATLALLGVWRVRRRRKLRGASPSPRA